MNLPIIKTPDEHKKEAKKRLKLAFDALRDTRDLLKQKGLFESEMEELFQNAGSALIALAKGLNK